MNLTDFVNSSDEERGKVYERVIPAAIAAQRSEFEQSLDAMLYAAYADGRADERDDIVKLVEGLDSPNRLLISSATLREVLFALSLRKPHA